SSTGQTRSLHLNGNTFRCEVPLRLHGPHPAREHIGGRYSQCRSAVQELSQENAFADETALPIGRHDLGGRSQQGKYQADRGKQGSIVKIWFLRKPLRKFIRNMSHDSRAMNRISTNQAKCRKWSTIREGTHISRVLGSGYGGQPPKGCNIS